MLLYESKSRPWDALATLAALTPEDITLTPEARADAEPSIWHDLSSEYDAENLCLELERRRDAGAVYSPEFWSFEHVWRRDEYQHYVSFQRLYALIYGESEASIAKRLHARAADFSHFGEFLDDEFKLCLMLAYDELCTTRAYAEDIPFYQGMGPAPLHDWIVNVRADEATHYMNALRVAQVRHVDRLDETETIMDQILTLDLTPSEYQATFILDHKGSSYPPELLRGCATTVFEQIRRVMR